MSEKSFFDFLWKIENFAFCIEKQRQPLYSPKFTVDSLHRNNFFIGVYPRGSSEKNAIGVYLFTESNNSEPDIHSLLVDISFLNYEGEALKSILDLNWNFQPYGGYGKATFILREEVILEKTDVFLPRGTLTLRCRIRKANGEDVKEFGRCIARTHVGVEHRAFNWVIDGIQNVSAEMYKSITIHSVRSNFPSVTMRLYFKPDLFSDGPLQLQIIQKDTARNNFVVCKISLINEHGNMVPSVTDEHFFNKDAEEQIWDFPLFVKKHDLIAKKEYFLPSGILTLRCEYTMSVGSEVEMIESLTFGPPSLRRINSGIEEPCELNRRPKSICSSLKDDLQNLHKNQELCDVSLKIGDEIFSAHKAILSARSAVFKAMFTSDMKENASGSVCISDLAADTVKQMLSFIYTDATDDLEVETALKLYYAADKYQIESLKELCSYYLGGHLEQSNVCEVLVLADVHKDHSLKRKAEEFIFFNESKVIPTEKWKELMKSDSKLAAGTLYQLCMKKMEF